MLEIVLENGNVDILRLKKLLDYNPTTSFNDGIKKFINWYKSYYN